MGGIIEMRKRLLSVLMIGAMASSLVACGQPNTANNGGSNAQGGGASADAQQLDF